MAPALLCLTLPLLALLILAARSGPVPRQDLAACLWWNEPALAEFPALSGFSPSLPPPGRCRARFYSLGHTPLWTQGDGWVECDFAHAPALAASPLDPGLGDYQSPACLALRERERLARAAPAPSLDSPAIGPKRL